MAPGAIAALSALASRNNTRRSSQLRPGAASKIFIHNTGDVLHILLDNPFGQSQPAGLARRGRDLLSPQPCPARSQPTPTTTKGMARIEQRTTSLMREVDWLSGDRRFPGELRLPGVACIIRIEARIERGAALHTETRTYVSSADLDAKRAGQAVRGHWAIENSLHRGLDVTFGADQSRLRKGHGAKSMAVVRHFALNLVQAAKDEHSIRLRRKLATWTLAYLEHLLNADAK